jgi:hypothetical protein
MSLLVKVTERVLFRSSTTQRLSSSNNKALLKQVVAFKENLRLRSIGSVRFASSNYKAALVKEFGKPLVIEEVKRKSLKKNEVRIGVYCCGINTVDKYNVLGESEPNQLTLPFIPGFEVGEIII